VQLTPILEVDEVANHRQMQERKMIHWMKDFKGSGVDFPLTGIPIKLSNGPEEISTSFSKLGENNNEILSLLGYTNKEIMAYQTSGII
jgi:crotonobetainyl-CoA:carnitine CoA-transferase CaiB-like acyl-CoA transferase